MRNSLFVMAMLAITASAAQAQQPILIVNGVRIDKCEDARTTTAGDKLALPDIDRAAIDKVEVLKGAAAAKDYGADAVSGVIIITTKPGTVVSPTLCGAAKKQQPQPCYIIDGVPQDPGCGSAAPPRPAADPVARYLYPPEMVMAHQQAITLSDKQRAAIQDLVKDLQLRVVDTQVKLALASEKLSRSLSVASIDEASVLQHIDQVLALEREVKRAQLTLLVRIKNQLSPAQQVILDKLR